MADEINAFHAVPPPQFDRIVDSDRCRELLQSFYALTGWPIRVEDPQGNIHITSQPVHQMDEIRRLLAGQDESPSGISRCESHIPSGETFVLVSGEEGLQEAVCPMTIDEEHVATAVLGPFFSGPPDEAAFRRRAKEGNADQEAVLAQIRTVPVRSNDEVERAVRFCMTLLRPFLEAHYREALNREFETRWEALFQNMLSGFARLGILRDEAGNPCDYRILSINSAFEQLIGTKREEVIGQTLAQAVPNIEKTWMDRFHRIAARGEHEMFVDYSPTFARFYAVDAFCPTSDEMICFVSDVTEVRALRKLLTQREQLFQAVFGCSPLAIEIYDQDGLLVDANPAFFNVFGIHEAIERVVGINLFDDPNLKPAEKERIRSGEIFEVEREFDFDLARKEIGFPTNSSGKRWLGGVFSPLVLEDSGEIEGYLGLVQDIDQRKRVELSLRESEERLRAVLDAMPDLILHIDRNGHCLNAHFPNESAAREHVLLDRSDQPCGGEIRRLRDAAIERALEQSTVQVYNHSFSEGEREVHEEVRVVPLPDKTALLVVRDVSERIEMQEALRQSDESLRRSNERLEQIIRENGSIMVVLSSDRIIREFNTTAERVFRRKREDVIGEDFMDLFLREEERPRVIRDGKDILAGNPLIGREQEMVDGNGRPLRILWNVVPSRNNEGEVDGFIGSGFEISELRRLEAELQEAQKMEAVGQLAAGVAHDFNNLLHAILGYAEMLGRAKSLDKARDAAKIISEAGRRGSELVRHLLLFSRKEPFDPEILDPNTVVMNVLSIAKSALGENVELLYRPDRKPGRVFADAGQVEQVIMNLCINAQHAIGSASGCVRINVVQKTLDEETARGMPDLQPGPYVDISVADDGCGIPKEIRDRIFEPFFTTKDVGQGTGLGLASAYAIAKRHQGSLTVESEVGRGSVFHLWLPLHDEKVTEGTETRKDHRKERTRRGKLEGKTVLLVEDEELALRLTESTLEAAGCRVLPASDGVEAIERFEAHLDDIDAIVLDLVMPRKSGKDVYDVVSRKRPDIPIIFCSGYSQSVVTSRFLNEISAEVLQKPFASEALLERLDRALTQ